MLGRSRCFLGMDGRISDTQDLIRSRASVGMARMYPSSSGVLELERTLLLSPPNQAIIQIVLIRYISLYHALDLKLHHSCYDTSSTLFLNTPLPL